MSNEVKHGPTITWGSPYPRYTISPTEHYPARISISTMAYNRLEKQGKLPPVLERQLSFVDAVPIGFRRMIFLFKNEKDFTEAKKAFEHLGVNVRIY